MPLLPGKKNVGHNIAEMENAGHPRDQAIAAALRVARRVRADGGEVDNLAEHAVRHFGTTTDHRRAGYVLQDGRMLDFSEGSDHPVRTEDHRAVEVLPGMTSKRSDAIYEFMRRAGAHRVDFNNGTMEASVMPHDKAIAQAVRGSRYNANALDLEASEPGGRSLGYEVHERPTVDRVRGFFAKHLTRQARAEGGSVKEKIFTGPIHSPVAGRTDHLPVHVPSGSYVIPADVVSAHGEGNTVAGFKVMRRIFGGTPYGGSGAPYGQGAGPYGQKAEATPYGGSGGPYNEKLATGGSAGTVPVIVAGGEMILDPDQVRRVGEGDIDVGHKVLDEFVKRSRKELIKTLSKLPGPRKD